MRWHSIVLLGALLVSFAPSRSIADTTAETNTETTTEENDPSKPHWRCDPTVLRHPGSYVGGTIAYLQARTWVDETEDHAKLEYGPIHSMLSTVRVGDALAEWFAIGFQLEIMQNLSQDKSENVGAMTLYLDTTFYPWEGLGLRPSAGLGIAFAMGEKEFDFGFGGPGSLAFSVLYEFRILRLFTIAPVAQVFWIGSDGFDGLFVAFGVELLKWFDSPTG